MRCSVREALTLDGGLFEELLCYAKADRIVEQQLLKEAARSGG